MPPTPKTAQFLYWIRIPDLLKRREHFFPTVKIFIVFDLSRFKVLFLPHCRAKYLAKFSTDDFIQKQKYFVYNLVYRVINTFLAFLLNKILTENYSF